MGNEINHPNKISKPENFSWIKFSPCWFTWASTTSIKCQNKKSNNKPQKWLASSPIAINTNSVIFDPTLLSQTLYFVFDVLLYDHISRREGMGEIRNFSVYSPECFSHKGGNFRIADNLQNFLSIVLCSFRSQIQIVSAPYWLFRWQPAILRSLIDFS